MELKTAFRWHLQNMPRHRHGFGDGLADAPRAAFALAMARRDVAAGIRRYPAAIRGTAMRAGRDSDKPGSVFIDNPERYGLRLVSRVTADCGGRNGYRDKRGDSGWYDNPHGESFRDGSGLIYGTVYQLRGQNGQARFVAAYQHGENDSGALFDLGTVYATDSEDSYWVDRGDLDDIAAFRDAARAADDMARRAAEAEREYQTAWRAGQLWADHGADIAATRVELLAILKERRAAKSQSGFPALCDAIRARVADLLADITRRRAERAELAEGDYRNLTFWNGDAALRAAFCDGADITTFPA